MMFLARLILKGYEIEKDADEQPVVINPVGGTAAWHSMGVYGYDDDWIEHPVAPDPLAFVPSSELQQVLIASWTSTN